MSSGEQVLDKHYVYIYLDPRKPGNYHYDGLPCSFLYQPLYIGRGQDYRWRRHLTNAKSNRRGMMGKSFFNVLRKILRVYGEPFLFKLYEGLSIEQSRTLEIECISNIGRRDTKTGFLYNQTSGGDGHRDLSPEATQALSEKLSRSLLEYYKNPAAREKTGRAMKGRVFSAESLKKMSDVKKGHKHSEETKEKMSAVKLGKKKSEETKRRMSLAQMGNQKGRKKLVSNTD